MNPEYKSDMVLFTEACDKITKFLDSITPDNKYLGHWNHMKNPNYKNILASRCRLQSQIFGLIMNQADFELEQYEKYQAQAHTKADALNNG